MNKIAFMGHVLSNNVVGLTQERNISLVDVEEPTNVAEVGSSIGLVNFSARYFPYKVTMAEPLRSLPLQKVDICLGKGTKQCFETFKTVFESMSLYT